MSIAIIKNTFFSNNILAKKTDNNIREWSEMKKYLILYAVTAILIGGIFTYGNIATAAADVSVYTVKTTDADNTITANGRLQYESEKTINSDKPCFIVSINASVGDTVKKGDILLIVDELNIPDTLREKYPDADMLLSAFSGSNASDEIMQELRRYCTRKSIYADFDGMVSSIMHNENEFVSRSSELIKISGTNNYIIPVNINETMINKIKCGQKVKIHFPAIDNKSYTGKVIRIAEEAKQISGLSGKETSVEVIIKPDKINDELRIGYNAECDIITSTDKNIILVPYEYIRSDENGSYVFIAIGRQANKRYITTGNEYRNGVAVKKGLKENEQIIINQNDVYDGQHIQVKKGG